MKSLEVKYKEVVDGVEQEKVMIVKTPTAVQLSDAQLVASKTFSKLINVREDGVGLLVKSKLDKFLKENNIWTDADDKALEDFDKQIKQKEKELKETRYNSEETKLAGKKIALEIRKLRNEKNILSSRKNEFSSYTIEGQADDARFNHLISSCLFHENGTPVFKDVNEYLEGLNKPHVVEAMGKFTTLFYNVDNDWEAKLPENKFLMQFGFVDSKLRFIKNGKLVDSEDRLVNEEGRYIDEAGNFVNRDGDRVDKDGNLIFEFQE